mmetsp:Transcript_127598/g.361062  ORF Transcript_127598/g.361062 Transcript_127598/m.361062 type:complete len:324 (-) Transcript_127598:543-1514(-)
MDIDQASFHLNAAQGVNALLRRTQAPHTPRLVDFHEARGHLHNLRVKCAHAGPHDYDVRRRALEWLGIPRPRHTIPRRTRRRVFFAFGTCLFQGSARERGGFLRVLGPKAHVVAKPLQVLGLPWLVLRVIVDDDGVCYLMIVICILHERIPCGAELGVHPHRVQVQDFLVVQVALLHQVDRLVHEVVRPEHRQVQQEDPGVEDPPGHADLLLHGGRDALRPRDRVDGPRRVDGRARADARALRGGPLPLAVVPLPHAAERGRHHQVRVEVYGARDVGQDRGDLQAQHRGHADVREPPVPSTDGVLDRDEAQNEAAAAVLGRAG